jgi:hypothetical protein
LIISIGIGSFSCPAKKIVIGKKTQSTKDRLSHIGDLHADSLKYTQLYDHIQAGIIDCLFGKTESSIEAMAKLDFNAFIRLKG